MSDTPSNPLESLLSDFALGPAWARSKSDAPKEKFKEGSEREYKPRGRDDRSGRDDRNQRGNGRRDERGQGGGNRRDFNRSDRGQPDFQREEIAPAEGVGVILLPKRDAIQLICKEVHQVARVYPLYDIAAIILAERSRSHAIFEISKKKEPFYQSKFDDAVFLTKEEALKHLLTSDFREKFIEESTFEIAPPKGNFQSVAKCGISGEWLGPPNYHGYQTEIRRIHRERYSHMPFENYAAKVRIERSEEAVNEWLDSMKTQTRWRILSEEESANGKLTPPTQPSLAESSAPENNLEEPTQDSDSPSDSLHGELTTDPPAQAPTETSAEPIEANAETAENLNVSETEAPAPSAPPTNDIKWFTDRAEAERAIAAEVLEKVFDRTHKAKVSASISGKNLSPGLLVRLKGTGSHHRKHPAIMIPAVCKILEGEHMPVFKRKGKLFTGPARPHALAADAVLAPRPGEMVNWIRENPPAKLEGLWKAVLPEGATAPPSEYAADLFWLLQQGHILLYTDDTLVVQEQPKPQEPKKPKATKDKKPAAEKLTEAASPKEEPTTEQPESSNDPADSDESQELPERQPNPDAPSTETTESTADIVIPE